MPRRERTAARRPARREPRLRVLIVCGAAKTEPAYFAGLRTWLGTSAMDIKVVERPRVAPDQVVGYARDHCRSDDFDVTWCVVDVDEYESKGGKVTKACELADRTGIRVAASNPCFEYWLLLHHADNGAPSSTCDPVKGRLHRFVPEYDKTALRFGDFAAGIEAAVERAKRRDPSGVDHRANPSSGVWVLAADLLAHTRDGAGSGE